MQKLFPDAAAALEGVLRNDMLIASGGFGLCGIPERLLDAIRDSGVTIILIRRPAAEPGPVAETVDEAFAWVEDHV